MHNISKKDENHNSFYLVLLTQEPIKLTNTDPAQRGNKKVDPDPQHFVYALLCSGPEAIAAGREERVCAEDLPQMQDLSLRASL